MGKMIQILIALAFHLVDFSTGLIGAFKEKNLKSSKMRDGMFKKMGFLICYGVCVLIDNYGSFIGLNIGVDLLPIIVLYSVTTELVSIFENIHRINPSLVPQKIINLLHIEVKGDE